MSYEWDINKEKIPFPFKAKILFGGLRVQASWFILGVSTVFFFVFAFDSTSFFYFRGKPKTTKGQITDIRRTLFATGAIAARRGGKGTPIYRYAYKYSLADSIYTGNSLALKDKAEKGEQVIVEYPPGSPSISRIKGMAPELRIGSTIPLVLNLVIILISLLTVASMTKKRFLGYRLLKRGTPTRAKAVSKKLLSKTRSSEWWEVIFEYKDSAGGSYKLNDRPYAGERIEAGDESPVIYDPDSPDKAFLIKNFPTRVEIDKRGRIKAPVKQSDPCFLLLPVLATFFVIISLYFEYLQ